ncbi:hypothetical protein [Flavobacterium sp.]|uniref:hypothetical protein n=1 Tax=Flavobacterium sp. TaxID=239 RepID=UPI00374FEF3B
MKRFFLIFALTISLAACSQTQNWMGPKTVGSTFKLLNVPQNNLNTKILSLNSAGNLQYRNASTFAQDSNVVHLDFPETIIGNKLFENASLSFNNGSVRFYNPSDYAYAALKNEAGSWFFGNTAGGWDFSCDFNGFYTSNATGTIKGNFLNTGLTANRNWILPNASGTIALLSDIPSIPNTIRYVALISMNGTSTPTATVFENTTGSTIEFFRQNVGEFYVFKTGGAPLGDYTKMNINLSIRTINGTAPIIITYKYGGSGELVIQTFTTSTNPPTKMDFSEIDKINIEITIYP